MLVLSIRTAAPEAEIGLFDGTNKIDYRKWHADRALAEMLHTKISTMLHDNNFQWQDVKGIVCYEGPGSFTGLRIGVSVANALSYGLGIPISASTGENWVQLAIERLDTPSGYIMPKYGSPVHITKPRK